ncbi:MAG: carbonic anhydrase [Rhodospirillales bacterium]|nr:carbonic anhydrase [Rhodospirillales bacterium]MCW8951669.1 carbonic anhydrase [Rhodospirillales bacterium]MCW8971568.1 carbonic anhydrase [Rhodospirillales bacterium]MCW9003387.1 carbonic anhydrase [Rhodospirillales bacterium]
MKDVSSLFAGFKVFRANYFGQRPQLFENLNAKGQKPKFLVIACSDSRVDPAILFNAEPGELFVVRNVANLVPPYQPDSNYHGTSAAMEFAVCDLKVQEIVILGHSQCGGINALCEVTKGAVLDREFITPWISIASDACKHDHGGDEDKNRRVEQAAIGNSIKNLRTFPWIAEREKAGELSINGLWFDMEQGALWAFDPEKDGFCLMEPSAQEA